MAEKRVYNYKFCTTVQIELQHIHPLLTVAILLSKAQTEITIKTIVEGF